MPSWIPSTLVYVENSRQEVLMLHRVKKAGDIHKDKYNGLGGKIEHGETPVECAIREVQEESGLLIEEPTFKGHIIFPNFDGKGNDWLVFFYHATKFSGEILSSSHEGELEWIPRDKIKDLPLWEGDKIFLDHVFSEGQFEGLFTYQAGKLRDHRIHIL